jgi:isoleucyl-tRNA synthetase
MKYQANTRRRAKEYENELVQYWKDNKTFEKSVEQRPADNAFVFYDGPPFITGVPHHGTLLSSIVKDAVPRYQTMKGKRVERVWGWDCHGLPAEVFTEKKLGITDKRDIGTKISLEEYIKTCRENMVSTGSLWEDTIDRIGRWVDFKGAYKTMDKEYMESVWWAFKQLYEKGKIYEGEKVLMYCVRDATPISKAEVAMDNSYQDVTDPSAYVKFKLKNSDEYLLVWTTTPWTLSANTALAVGAEVTYQRVKVGEEVFIVAEDRVAPVLTDEKHQPVAHELLGTLKGEELAGLAYESLFEDGGENAHKIWAADFVTTESGTGIVHIAPAFGEDDYVLSRANKIPLVMTLNEEGEYLKGEWQGKNIWHVNKEIAKTLHERGVIWKIDYIRHSYPHCHRCGTKLIYMAHPSWFMDIDGQRTEMLEKNTETIQWFPEHIKHGRFEKTVETAPDWNISRDRFWATAMPVWKGVDATGIEHVQVIGSYAELKELSGVELDDYHRPWIDDVVFTIDDVEYRRIDKVLDCWFESGSMPFAQFHYPFENQQKFEDNFPGDFVVEYVGQVRAWFYYMHAVGVGLFDQAPFKNVVVTGTLLGEDGRKLSKSLNNFTDPNELMDQYSADSLRFLLLSSTVMTGEDFAVKDKDVSDIARKLSMIWNMYDFFTMYASVDSWEWNGDASDPTETLTNPLDLWVVSRVHEVTSEVGEHMDRFDLPNATKPLLLLLDDASNWYVRRSRKRFWKSEDDSDKNDAYKTLHYVLLQLSLIFAPFTPFLAEELYQKLTGGESVHLLDWPEVGKIDKSTLRYMSRTRQIIEVGLGQRMQKSENEESIKVRQPLSRLVYYGEQLTPELEAIIAEEVNVKLVEKSQGQSDLVAKLDKTITPELKREGLTREIVRFVQNARKQAGLQVDDRIVLSLTTENAELQQAINQYKDEIAKETLTTEFRDGVDGFKVEVKVEGEPLGITLKKV